MGGIEDKNTEHRRTDNQDRESHNPLRKQFGALGPICGRVL
jgi:hypothetical protein